MNAAAARVIGRYVLFDEIATGGMAAVHFGRMIGPAGFARTVAIKRLHPQFAKDPEFVAMFLDEARLAARIRHLHVVPTLDVLAHEGEVLLVMEYVQGVALSHLARALREKGEGIPAPIAVGIVAGALLGLQAAHDAKSDSGTALDVVHRDVSPQNILVGVDGAARVADFGIAKAVGRLQTTREGQVKGKSGYMAPEQVRGHAVDRRTDVYAASVVLWEVLTGKRLFASDSPLGAMNQILEKVVPKPSDLRPSVPKSLDAIVLRGLSRKPSDRYPSARDMALALEGGVEVASARKIGEWVEHAAPEILAARAERIAEIESSTSEGKPGSSLKEDAPNGTKSGVVSVGDVGPGRRSPRWLAVALLGLAVAVVFAAFAALRVGRRGPAHTPAAVAPPSGEAPPVAQPESSVATLPAASAGASTGVAAGPWHHVVKPRRSRPTKPSATGQGPSCTPPYTIDADGVRHWKDGC